MSLNSSVHYVGQALGSAIGGMLCARDLLFMAGYLAAAFLGLALTMVLVMRPKPLPA